MEYYVETKNYEVPIRATTWKNFEPLPQVKEVNHQGPHIALIP